MRAPLAIALDAPDLVTAAAWAAAVAVNALNSVDLPTFGSPTIPQ